MVKNVLTDKLSEPLAGATMAKVDVDVAEGNLTIDKLADGEQLLVSGTLQYVENQGLPTRSVNVSNGHATLTLRARGTGRPWFRFPWSACNGGTDWQIHLNPNVQSDIVARSGGGNVKLNLAGMTLTHVAADTGGGNLDVVLPDHAEDLRVDARTGGGTVTVQIGCGITGSSTVHAHTGAGNVDVQIPSGLSARIHASSGLGKVIVDPQFNQTDKHTYQSSDFDRAANKVELTVDSGAGTVRVNTR